MTGRLLAAVAAKTGARQCRSNRHTVSVPAKIFHAMMKTSKVELRLILALDRFVQARTLEEKRRAARWVNAWDALAKAESRLWEREVQTQHSDF